MQYEDGYIKVRALCLSIQGERNAGKILKAPGRRDLRPSDHGEME